MISSFDSITCRDVSVRVRETQPDDPACARREVDLLAPFAGTVADNAN